MSGPSLNDDERQAFGINGTISKSPTLVPFDSSNYKDLYGVQCAQSPAYTMPPYVPRKRTRSGSHSSGNGDSKQRKKTNATRIAPPRKPTLFDDLDATSTPRASANASSSAKIVDSSDDGSSSLSSLSAADFEDVPLTNRLKLRVEDAASEEDEDDGLEFEDVQTPLTTLQSEPIPSGDLELTLTKDTRISLTNVLGKKGPSKLERRVRLATHCVHVQFLLWHNAIRNSWLCDPEVQGLLISHLPPRLWDEVDRWRRNSGLEIPQEPPKKHAPARVKRKGKQKEKNNITEERASREWSGAAQQLERGAIDLSHGDPLFRLMKALSAWWKQRFRVTAPGLRKLGYMSLERLDRLTKAYVGQESDTLRFGERIESLEEFKTCAQDCTGSRDVGSQLFTALLRAIGLEARMVANLQPLGFGWNKLEDAEPENENPGPNSPSSKVTGDPRTNKVSSTESKKPPKPRNPRESKNPTVSRSRPRQTSQRTRKPVLEESSDSELLPDESDDSSVVEIPQIAPKKKVPTFDKDLDFPHYWSEVLSPVTSRYMPVDPIVKPVVAAKRELVELLEPRGAKADKARQVMAYVVGFSQDGTAKDVTVRYLKRQMLPGRTKGMRIPIEKIPVHNRNGKVKRYDQYDWFKEVMRGYGKGSKKHPITDADEEEDATDLKPARPEKKEVKDGDETLQYYKQSKEFVLERHLKREEALVPKAKAVKTFRMKSKGNDTKSEPVFSRKDVVQVKSAETWHKQGRAPKPGEEPLKRVPYRAATTNRRREIAEAEAVTGEKVLQGLYSFDQTDWIIPPPIRNGIIPKNEYGNIDLFVEHMCPKGAVHVPYRGTVRVCKRLEIDYAEAVVDFEFGHRMAVPVIQGVVIAEEYHDRVMEELAKDEAERNRKEDEKRRKAALAMWRKFLMGMRIMERIRQDYGDTKGDIEVFGHDQGPTNNNADEDEDMAGGFLPEGYESEGEKEAHQVSGFFPVVDEDDDDGEDTLQVEHNEPTQQSAKEHPSHQPTIRSGAKKSPARAKGSTSTRRRRRVVSASDEEDDKYDEPDDDYVE